MALLFLPSLSSPSVPIATVSPSRKINVGSLALRQGIFHGLAIPAPTHSFSVKRLTIVHASSGIDGKEESEPNPLPPSQAAEGEAVVPVESLPLESKQQMMAEQKLKMKLAKKIRLRRKRLVRKRRMRKKGRWPPSKMKKNKNV